jgi:hypothetical protein
MAQDLLAEYSLDTSRAPTPGVSAGEIAQPYTELANALRKTGEAATDIATTTAERAGYQAVTTDAAGNVQIAKAPIIGPASQAYERAVKMAALAAGEGAAKDADIALRDQFKDNPQGYLQAANTYKDGVMKRYADLGVPEVATSLGRAIDTTTTYNYRQLWTEKRDLDFQSAKKDNNDGLKDAQETMVAGARAGAIKDPDYKNWPAPFQLAHDKWRQLINEKLSNPQYAYSQKQADYDQDQLDSELRANGIAHHFIDEMYKNSDNPSSAAATTLESARSILTDPTLKLKDSERHKIYNYVAGEIRSEDALRKQDAFEARQAREIILGELRTGSNPRNLAEQAGNVIDVLRRTGFPGEAASFLAQVKITQKGGSDYGRQPLDTQDAQRNTFAGGVTPSSATEARLIQHESQGRPWITNDFGFAGLYQFGAPRLADLGIYKPGPNENLQNWNQTSKFEPGKWSGTFNVPGHPEVKTLSDFLQNPAAQKAAYDSHTARMDQEISTLGLDKYEGQTVGGVPITRAGLYTMMHLAGAQGARVALQSGGRIQVADAYGTTPLQYASMAAHAEIPTPAASLFLQVANASADQRDLRAEWKTINEDFQKTKIPPSDKVINDIADRANRSDDFGLNAQVSHDVALMRIEAQQPGGTLAQQQARITEISARGAAGEFGAGYGEVAKNLTEITQKIREGMDKDPISTAVSYSRGRLATPAPLDFSAPDKFAAGLAQRVPIARWANQTWQGQPVAALDQADVDQIKGQLANPDPNVKAQIYQSLATLPEDVRGPTLKKIAGNDPLGTAEAAAGSMMRTNPEVANSLFQGFAMLRGGKFDVDKAFGTKNPQGETFTDDFNKALPATVFPMGAARTDPTGDYATMGEMVRARYAYLSAQSGDMNYSADRVTKAVNDVTGGVLSMNGGKFIAPARGMSQTQFDGVLAGITDRDLGNARDTNQSNFAAATQTMSLTPQEQALYQRHLTNLYGPGGVTNANGSRSTLFQASVEHEGKTYNIPTVWDGKILPVDQALKRVEAEGWDKFPAYSSEQEAETRYQRMHAFMDEDTRQYSTPPPGAVTSLNGQPISAAYLRGQAQLQNADGPGRYYVTLGRDQTAPIYAYQNTNTERPNKFVLDLRGRQPPPFAAAMMWPPGAEVPGVGFAPQGAPPQPPQPPKPRGPPPAVGTETHFEPTGYGGIRG